MQALTNLADAGSYAIDYFEGRFPDLGKMPTSGDNANCAEWLLSITTKVPWLTQCIPRQPPLRMWIGTSSWHARQWT